MTLAKRAFTAAKGYRSGLEIVALAAGFIWLAIVRSRY